METSSILVSIFLLLVTVILYMVYTTRKSQKFRKIGIPGPVPWPLLGNLPSLLKEGLVNYHKRLYKEFEKERIYVINITGAEFLVVKDLDMIKDMCIKNFNNFVDRRTLFDKEPYGTMMTQLRGDQWRHVRNTVSPTFSSGKLKRMFDHIEEASRTLSSNIKQSSQEEKPVELKDICACFTMDVIASTGFGVKIDSLNNKDEGFVRHTKNFLDSFSNIFVSLALSFPKLGYLMEKMGYDVFSKKMTRYFASFVDAAMSNRQKGDTKRQDFLQLVVDAEETQEDVSGNVDTEVGKEKRRGLTHAEIQGNALVFILAGYSTVSTTMSMILFLLAHHPECREKLQEELDRVLNGTFPTYENVSELAYLDMCINESLRLYPPGFVLDRQCTEECDIRGFHIPKKTYVAFPVMSIHLDPKLWPEPEKFDPERFTASNKEGRHPFAHLPFGQGPRNCIGMRLALLEMKVAIASILQEMTPIPCEKSSYPPLLDKHRPKPVNGLWVNFEPRGNRHCE